MDYNYEEATFDATMYAKYNPGHTGDTLASPFGHMSDDDLLNAPAESLARAIRVSACGGRNFVSGDDVDSISAVHRIRDEDATMDDFRPRLDWQHHNPVETEHRGDFRCNVTFASRSVPPRVSEPSLVPATKVSGFGVAREDVPTGPLEHALIKAAQVIQLTKRAGGDDVEMARIFGLVWGDEDLFMDDHDLNLLGDVSLPRFLAKSTKRRFELYRNIGWTSIVNAGYNQARSTSYGNAAVINWQRRAELAKLYLHLAAVIEGRTLAPGDQFGITVRVPAYTVKHLTWEDLALRPNSSYLAHCPMPTAFVTRAKDFLQRGIYAALRHASRKLAAHNLEFEWDEHPVEVAGEFDRLVFAGDFALEDTELKVDRAKEIAHTRATERRLEIHGAAKAHDIRTAVMEILASNSENADASTHQFAFLWKLKRACEGFSSRRRLDVVYAPGTYAETKLVALAAGLMAQRPKTAEDKSRRAEWSRLWAAHFPKDLTRNEDPYTVQAIVRGTVYTMLSEPSSQVAKAVEYNHTHASDQLHVGLMRAERSVGTYGTLVYHTAVENIRVATKTFYRTRYRKYAAACNIAAMRCDSAGEKDRLLLEALGRWALADYAHNVDVATDELKPTVFINPAHLRSIWVVYAHGLTRLGIHKPPKFTDPAGDDAKVWSNKLLETRRLTLGLESPGSPEWVQDRFTRYLHQHQSDFDKLYAATFEWVPPPEEAPATSALAETAAQLFDFSIKPVAVDTTDDMVSFWASVSGMTREVEAEELEALAEWMDAHAGEYIDDFASYKETHSKKMHADKARALLEEWLNRKDEVEDAEYDAGELF